jgi:hypothetical protein
MSKYCFQSCKQNAWRITIDDRRMRSRTGPSIIATKQNLRPAAAACRKGHWHAVSGDDSPDTVAIRGDINDAAPWSVRSSGKVRDNGGGPVDAVMRWERVSNNYSVSMTSWAERVAAEANAVSIWIIEDRDRRREEKSIIPPFLFSYRWIV